MQLWCDCVFQAKSRERHAYLAYPQAKDGANLQKQRTSSGLCLGSDEKAADSWGPLRLTATIWPMVPWPSRSTAVKPAFNRSVVGCKGGTKEALNSVSRAASPTSWVACAADAVSVPAVHQAEA